MPYLLFIMLVMALSHSTLAQEQLPAAKLSTNAVYSDIKNICREESKQKQLKGLSAIKYVKKCITNHPSVKARWQH